MLSTSTFPTIIVRFASSLPFSNVDIKGIIRPSVHRDVALREAFVRFAEEYGNWVDSHFDEHFLAHGGATILSDFASGKVACHEAAVQLAQAWDSQMGPVRSVVRKRRIADAAMAANSLLGWYRVELKGNTYPKMFE